MKRFGSRDRSYSPNAEYDDHRRPYKRVHSGEHRRPGRRDSRDGDYRDRFNRYESERERFDRELLNDDSIIPIHLRIPRRSLWNIFPPGCENMTAQEVKNLEIFPVPGFPIKKTPRQSTSSGRTRSPSLSVDSTAASPLPPGVDAQVARGAKRIYVGNIPENAVVDDLKTLFNDVMHHHKLTEQPGSCIVHCQTAPGQIRGYVFFTMRTFEEATNALALNGISYLGSQLKVSRPKDFIPIPGVKLDPPDMYIPGVVCPIVRDSPYKIYMGSIPTTLKDSDVRGLLETFGPLRSFNLMKDSSTGLNKGFAFAEFADRSTTAIACQGLNGMEIGNKKIMVHLASEHRKPTSATGANAIEPSHATGDSQVNTALECVPGLVQSNSLSSTPVTSGLFDRMLQLHRTDFEEVEDRLWPSPVIILFNMVCSDELLDEKEFKSICYDLKQESVRYGVVKSIAIPRPIANRPNAGVGRVFIEYASENEAKNALFALAGRKFADRTVLGTFYPLAKYQQADYSF